MVFDVPLDDYKKGYASTIAPLVVKNKVIVGVAGGEYGAPGFIDAYDVESGRRVWRHSTVPAPGEPGSETWPADSAERGGAGVWVTGSYDPGPMPSLPKEVTLPHDWHRDSPGEFGIGIFLSDVPDGGNGGTALMRGSHLFPYCPRWQALRPAA